MTQVWWDKYDYNLKYKLFHSMKPLDHHFDDIAAEITWFQLQYYKLDITGAKSFKSWNESST